MLSLWVSHFQITTTRQTYSYLFNIFIWLHIFLWLVSNALNGYGVKWDKNKFSLRYISNRFFLVFSCEIQLKLIRKTRGKNVYLHTINKIEDKQQELQIEEFKAKQIFVVTVDCFFFAWNEWGKNMVHERAFDDDDDDADFLIIFSSRFFSPWWWEKAGSQVQSEFQVFPF